MLMLVAGCKCEDIESNIINAVEPEVRFINGVKKSIQLLEGRLKCIYLKKA